jgi:hypothetical protein
MPMTEFQKLLNALETSGIPERDMIIPALQTGWYHSAGTRQSYLEGLLSFKRGFSLSSSENKSRLHARTALAILAVVPWQTNSEQELAAVKTEIERNWGHADAERTRFNCVKSLVWSRRHYQKCHLTPAVFTGMATLDAGTIERNTETAVCAAQNALEAAHRAVVRWDRECQSHYRTWFGAIGQVSRLKLEKDLQKLVTELQTRVINIDWTQEDVWGMAVPDGYKDNKPLMLGRKFFSPDHSCENGHARGLDIHWDRIAALYAKRDELENKIKEATKASAAIKAQIKAVSPQGTVVGRATKPDFVLEKNRRQREALEAELAGVEAEDAKNEADAKKVLEEFNRKSAGKVPWYCTIVHELSHWRLKTDDHEVQLRDVGTRTIYGAAFCQELARVDPSKAKTNADNWRFFVEMYGP